MCMSFLNFASGLPSFGCAEKLFDERVLIVFFVGVAKILLFFWGRGGSMLAFNMW